jgi:hypothetical protein
MVNWRFLMAYVLCLTLCTNCNKKDDIISADVYALVKGSDRKIKYYKNEVLHILEDTGAAMPSDIYVDGTDIYVSGTVNGMLKCWKNDVEIFVDNTITNIGTTGLCVSAGNLYISGYRQPNALEPLKTPFYWTNNNRLALTSDPVVRASTSGIAVENGNVYISGFEQIYLQKPGSHIPKYWKNSRESTLPGNPGYTTGISVENGTVYISGSVNSKPVYWRNGIVQKLEIPSGDFFYETSGIAVAADNVYVSGTIGQFIGETRIIKPVYWKNGKMMQLNITDTEYGTHGIFVHKSDVYTYGYSFRQGAGNSFIYRPKYWRNNIEIALPGDGECVSMLVK